jgi:hypothetical protein
MEVVVPHNGNHERVLNFRIPNLDLHFGLRALALFGSLRICKEFCTGPSPEKALKYFPVMTRDGAV